MANRSCRNHRQTAPMAPITPIASTVSARGISEPEVRRWPHPISQPLAPAPSDATLQYICCSLSYQNELLSEIKALLEQLSTHQSDHE